jgi:protein-L-isoaspartate(D-aspartate) O-methyltransferase
VSDLTARRRFYAEEIQVTSNVQSAAVVEALAVVPRERFLPRGPWTIRGEADFQARPRQTPDANPRHVYHNVAIAIDAARMLFNGAPGVVAMAVDALALRPGDRVLHLGTGLGYYTAILASCVGPTGRVLGVEVDAELAASARANLADFPWVEVRHGNGTEPLGGTFDAMLINAGVTHPLPAWLDALAADGRLIVPITASMPPMTTIGKGPMVLITKNGESENYAAVVAGFVAIYSALGVRDEAANMLVGRALARSPFAPVKSLRRDVHVADATCWLHTSQCCLSLEPAAETPRPAGDA